MLAQFQYFFLIGTRTEHWSTAHCRRSNPPVVVLILKSAQALVERGTALRPLWKQLVEFLTCVETTRLTRR